ncbi:hypothetical protein Back11_60110 [Paenibacillus baekrokdamisoli]|uniref:Uncharacterized protein n=1 Tax=Paenibacillus baekrokdamisoli TaxID=1712516 RepID=A0A3G9J1N1_9BACL|nr:hypothetical protein [Paenibacillus baekrokdamisoli]MBB3071297.1 hypothetical protein [Paenibacillus baekrokdamisoli]BBH24666.1 hypothetical protein Back11_60110 [Paenibacillus baekrokdamisoli]
MKENHEASLNGKRIQTAVDEVRWTSILQKIGCVLAVIGMVITLYFCREFKDTNLGLMIGIGFIIGGSQVAVTGTLVRVLQSCSFAKPSQAAIAVPADLELI